MMVLTATSQAVVCDRAGALYYAGRVQTTPDGASANLTGVLVQRGDETLTASQGTWDTRAHTWTFAPVDDEAFPAIAVARDAGTRGGSLTAVFNAANEVAAWAFLDGRLGFLNIAAVVAETLERATKAGMAFGSGDACGAALSVDAEVRLMARSIIAGLASAA